jgi:hypothetical protein
VAHRYGPAGEFFDVTWPGAVGTLTAVAPGRFAAAINQAPLFRRSQAEILRTVDYTRNLVWTLSRERGMAQQVRAATVSLGRRGGRR